MLISKEIKSYTDEQFDHALYFMTERRVVQQSDGKIHFRCSVESEFK
jgi:hypothetical protein